eukprot:358313-Chlamydomonas_euryale.AAC.12
MATIIAKRILRHVPNVQLSNFFVMNILRWPPWSDVPENLGPPPCTCLCLLLFSSAHAQQLSYLLYYLCGMEGSGNVAYRCTRVSSSARDTMLHSQSQSQSDFYRERTHEGFTCDERSKAEGIKQGAGRCHKGHAVAHGPEPPHTNPAPSTGT